VGELWGSLVPLIIGSALVPIQIVITAMLLRSKAGRITAVALVAGMTVIRLAQGVVFGFIVGKGTGGTTASDGPGHAASLLLLVVAILFYVTAIKQLFSHPDDDAPPPRWMAMIDSITPLKAFALGTGIMLIGAKFWVFTLAAINAIAAADLGQGASVLAFLAFVLLAESILLLSIGVAYLLPAKAGAFLDAVIEFLTRHNRVLVIVIGTVFGTWFLIKALNGLGLL